METFESSDGHVFVRLDRGEDLLESIVDACATRDVDSGIVTSGVGTLSTLAVHYVNRTDLPAAREDRTVDLELEGAWEVTTLDGIVADGEPHLHVTAFDGERTVGGHLEEGCAINVLGEVSIRRVEGLDLQRRPDDRGVSRLGKR